MTEMYSYKKTYKICAACSLLLHMEEDEVQREAYSQQYL